MPGGDLSGLSSWMSNTSSLVLPYLAVGQAQKHVTVNESLRRLDALVQLSVVSATTSVHRIYRRKNIFCTRIEFSQGLQLVSKYIEQYF